MPSRVSEAGDRPGLAPFTIRPGEGARVGLSFLYFFALLSAYSMLRPVRDEMGVRAGVEHMQWLFTGTFVAMLLLTPIFGHVASRYPRKRFLPTIYLFFASNLAAFYLALREPSLSLWAAPGFFIWLSVFNLFAVSIFWSFMSDLFRPDEARRLFGLVAAGGSAGALAGPALTALLAPRAGTERLLLFAAVLLAVCALASRLLLPHSRAREERSEAPIGGGALAGVVRTGRSPFLIGVSVVMVCYAMLSTTLYFAQAEIVGSAVPESGQRTSLFALVDLSVNGLTILLQLFATGWLLRRLGPGRALALVSAVVTVGFAAIGVAPGLLSVLGVQVLHRAGHFAVGRPARELLFVSRDAETRYKAKNFIDTTVFRASDAGSAWVLAALRGLGAGTAALAWIAVPIGVLWAVASDRLERARDERSRDGAVEAREGAV